MRPPGLPLQDTQTRLSVMSRLLVQHPRTPQALQLSRVRLVHHNLSTLISMIRV